MKKILIILILAFILSGCFHPRTKLEAPPEVEQVATPPGEVTPFMRRDAAPPQVDESDYLDSALNELDAVE